MVFKTLGLGVRSSLLIMASIANDTHVSVTKNFSHRVQKKLDDDDDVQVNNNNKRCSPRLRDIPNTKKPYYGPTPRKQQPIPPVSPPTSFPTNGEPSSSASATTTTTDQQGVVLHSHSRIDKTRVKQTLRIYNKHYLHFFQVFYFYLSF